jgi:CheY-like chemotaxis protein
VQLDSGLSRYYSGTGLGLALVYGMAELHGGSVTVESTAGSGTRINVYLPWEPGAELRPEPGSGDIKESNKVIAENRFKNASILLADDSKSNASMLSSYLEHMGYQVTTVHDGVEAVAAAQLTPPDIILIDIQLDSMDGLEATRRMRANPKLSDTPIIALTALAMPGDRERCLKAGANDYLSKPLGVKELHQIIQEWLDRA